MFEKFRASVSDRLNPRTRAWIVALRQGRRPSPVVGGVDFGDLRRLSPIGPMYGWERGDPVDRYYIEKFLDGRRAAIRGRVLEISEDTYSRRFGGDRVETIDVLHLDDPAPPVTILADLSDAPHIPSDTFDCVIITQTLMVIYDFARVVETLHRILKPGGAVLATTAGLTQIADPAWRTTWYWGFTAASATRMFEDVFGKGRVEVATYGNVLSTVAFLHGISKDELRPAELDHVDPEYQMLISVAARKAGGRAG